jgi:S-adenosyl-L-methionine hydrolase (adenosine-forming)
MHLLMDAEYRSPAYILPAQITNGKAEGQEATDARVRKCAYTVPMRPICFISDYGITGVLVGTCKGVMMSIAPQTTIIDVTHSVAGFDVIRGAETLRHATRYMPEDAVYLAVVDPGDKTKRRALAAEVRSGAYLVGPDNGLLLPAAEALGGMVRAVHLTNPRYHVQPVSNTFHGRDVFSPVAAHLAAGVALDDLGDEADPASMASIDFPGFRRERDGGLTAEIIDIDRFGNARLSVMQEDVDLSYDTPLEIGVRDESMDARYVETFGASETGDLVLVPDSHWRLSLAVNRGNAARALLLSVGDEVRIDPSEEPASR